jgi:UDP-N-acetylmuramoyl-L-alanyl-D-glutamate--2,6-diaminopimelate ligase
VREVLGALGPATAPVLEGPDDVLVHGVTLDSRAVRPGDLYAALPGARAHGAAYAAAAAAAGAAAVLTDPQGREQALVTGLPVVVVARPRAVLGALSAWLYGTPAARLRTLGVTGTNGKTTTTCLLDAALRAAGRRTGLVGTVELRVGDERIPSTGTTPEAPDLHALLAAMVERGVTVCSMEISSHALALHRVDGLVLDVAAFTNLSRDHLDYHGTMEGYFAAKARLFTPAFARRAVVCVDDDWGRRLVATTPLPVVTAATVRPPEGAAPADWQVVRTGTEGGLPVALVRTPAGGEVLLRVPLPGAFNVANALVALAVLVEAGLDAGAAAAALAVAGAVPGRMERVHGLGAPGEPLAVVDYAHSPDAITAALEALADGGRPRVVVLGAGGNRDREKRPLMGEAAATAADVVLVTDDNPRSEDPAAIRAAVLEGALRAARSSGATVLEVGDRAAAVTEGVARAWGGGVLLVAGKGHEQGQEVAGSVLPFDDRVALRTALTDAALEAGSVPAVQEENAR